MEFHQLNAFTVRDTQDIDGVEAWAAAISSDPVAWPANFGGTTAPTRRLLRRVSAPNKVPPPELWTRSVSPVPVDHMVVVPPEDTIVCSAFPEVITLFVPSDATATKTPLP